MALLKTSGSLKVVNNPRNTRYRIELRDYRSALTVGFDVPEALAAACDLISCAAGLDHAAAIAVLSDLADSLSVEETER